MLCRAGIEVPAAKAYPDQDALALPAQSWLLYAASWQETATDPHAKLAIQPRGRPDSAAHSGVSGMNPHHILRTERRAVIEGHGRNRAGLKITRIWVAAAVPLARGFAS